MRLKASRKYNGKLANTDVGGNRTTRRQTNSRQSSRGLVNSRTSQVAEMFDLKFGVYNSSKCYFGQITLFIRCQYSTGLELWLWSGLTYK